MWWKIALAIAVFVAVYFATVELITWLIRKSVRKWYDKDLAEIVRAIQEEEKKRAQEMPGVQYPGGDYDHDDLECEEE